jgi:protein gp37
VPEKLAEPLKWKQSRRIFVNSMSDLFHRDVDDVFIEAVFRIMIAADWHVFQVLTKRADRMKAFVSRVFPDLDMYPHIWLGVSVENKQHGLPRIDDLRETAGAVRFLSVEPLLENLGKLALNGIHWVIVGGESGRAPREMRPEWARSVRDQCMRQKVPFFFKQWGGKNKKANGRKLDNEFHDEFPEVNIRPKELESRRRALDDLARVLEQGAFASATGRVLQGT